MPFTRWSSYIFTHLPATPTTAGTEIPASKFSSDLQQQNFEHAGALTLPAFFNSTLQQHRTEKASECGFQESFVGFQGH